MIKDINFKHLGLIDYSKAFDLMKNHIQEKDFKDEIWFLEHNPVFTLGTAANKKHILSTGEIPVFQSDRGGEVTYHGPGQLVVYFLINVKKHKIGPKEFVRKLQDFVKELLEEYSIKSNFIAGAPGVYVNEKNGKLFFENLTMVPIERDLINFKLLTSSEKNYLFKYHLDVYCKISKYLKSNEKQWLASFL